VALIPTEKQKMKKFLTWFLAAISFNSWIQCVLSGHEVLHGFPESQLAIKRDEIAIIQYDSRPLGNYWNVTARWNREYSRKNGHKYYYFSQKTDYCVNGDVKLGAPWCKVRAMIAADKYIQDSKMIIFLDSDALVTANYSMDVIISYIKKDLYWNWREKPVVFNQDGPGFACKHAIFVNYGICLNSGVVLWMKGDLSTKILNEWWDSSGDFLNGTNFRMNWKLKVSPHRRFLVLVNYFIVSGLGNKLSSTKYITSIRMPSRYFPSQS
jgi:hypothetical protein